jgi:integrase
VARSSSFSNRVALTGCQSCAANEANKRGNGEVSITRRKNGNWCAQYIVHTAEGRKRKTLYCKTRQEVATTLAKALSDRENGLILDAGDHTLDEYLNWWLNGSVRGSVKEDLQ